MQQIEEEEVEEDDKDKDEALSISDRDWLEEEEKTSDSEDENEKEETSSMSESALGTSEISSVDFDSGGGFNGGVHLLDHNYGKTPNLMEITRKRAMVVKRRTNDEMRQQEREKFEFEHGYMSFNEDDYFNCPKPCDSTTPSKKNKKMNDYDDWRDDDRMLMTLNNHQNELIDDSSSIGKVKRSFLMTADQII